MQKKRRCYGISHVALPAPPPAASTPFSFFLMRVHRVRTNANTCGYDVLYQNTVLHLSCHELYVAHLVCLGLRYVTLVFFLVLCVQ